MRGISTVVNMSSTYIEIVIKECDEAGSEIYDILHIAASHQPENKARYLTIDSRFLEFDLRYDVCKIYNRALL